MLRVLARALGTAIICLSCGGPRSASDVAIRNEAPPPGADYAPVFFSSNAQAPIIQHGSASIPVTAEDPQWGEPLAPVTIVEFGDFECPFTARVAPTLERIRKEYGPSRVRLVWKHHPLPFHKRARSAHEASMAVFELGGSQAFFAFHDRALAGRKALTPENFEVWATAAGVGQTAYQSSSAAGRLAGRVDDGIALAKRVGATGTPAFRINGVTVSGAQPFEKFKEVIDSELAEAKKLVDAGTRPEEVYSVRTNRNFTQPAPSSANDEKVAGTDEDLSVWKIPVYADDPVRGPKDALVTIVEFSEFQCPFCKRVKDTLDEIFRRHPKDVRLVWKDSPLPFHPRAKPAAILARIVYEKRGDKAFWKVHDELFESQPALEDEDLRRIVEPTGLAWDPIARALEKGTNPKVEQSMDIAIDAAARGTPHFFINGVRLAGAQPLEVFEERIQDALETALFHTQQGVPRTKIYETLIKDGKNGPPPDRKDVPPPDATTPFRGNAAAPVVIQVFSEFQCPFCRKVRPTLAEIEKEFGGRVKLVWRHLPLPFHKDAPLAAEAAQEVFAQKGSAGFWRYHDALFEAQETGIGRDVLETLAAKQGVDMTRFVSALDSRKHRPKVEADVRIATDASINGTPGFVINGYFLSGAQPTPAFRKVIRRALDDKKRK
jgi:protein-disulfide isomerase